MPRTARSPWLVVLGSGLVMTVGPAPLILSTTGVFIIPVTEATAWSRSAVTAALGAGSLAMAIGFPLAGWLLNRYAMRLIALIGMIGFVTSIAMIGIAGRWLPLFVLFFILQGFFGAALAIPYSKAVVSWFDNRRALAIGVMAGIAAIGTTVMPLYANFLVSSLGWNLAYVGLAATAALVGFPSLLGLVRVRAERSVRGRLVPAEQSTADGATSAAAELPGLTAKQAFRTRHFMLIAGSLALAGMVVNALQVNIVPILVEGGFSASLAAGLLGVLGVGSLVGRVLGGLILDRFPTTMIGAAFVLLPIIGMLFLDQPLVSAVLAVALIGFAIGLESDLLTFYLTRYLGVRAYPQILGVALTVFLIGTAVAPTAVSAVFDATGSYDGVTPWLAGLLVVSAVMILCLGKFVYPAVHGFDRAAAEDEFAASELVAREFGTDRDTAERVPDTTSRA